MQLVHNPLIIMAVLKKPNALKFLSGVHTRALLDMAILCWLLPGCDPHNEKTLFQLLPSSNTGITFKNELIETDSFNVLSFEYIYNGAGVGVGDVNNDGLSDIFFAGN